MKLYGRDKVVVGDLVFPKHVTQDIDMESTEIEPDLQLLDGVDSPAADADSGGVALEGEGDGEEGDEEAEEEGRDAKRSRKCRESLPEVHVVTEEDVEKETFDVTEVVLPMPG